MALAEGMIRKDGRPARKPGYPKGSPPPNAGRPLHMTCRYVRCEKPRRAATWQKDGTQKPELAYCSDEHRSLQLVVEHLKRTYDITLERYEEMLETQGGVCAICGSSDPKCSGRPRKDGRAYSVRFHVDHDHKTGKIRGLLCSGCNRGLGAFSDNPATLRAGAAYLEERNGTREE